jgi:hypothetical protein
MVKDAMLRLLGAIGIARSGTEAQRLRRIRRPGWLARLPGRVRPVSAHWGFDRGTPVDRYYIERFLAAHASDIRGRALEVKDSTYTTRFGVGVTHHDVLDIDASNPLATVVADLSAADHVASDRFDCFVLTQTLQLIFDVRAAIAHAHRLLAPGGVMLVTVPCVSRIVPRFGLEGDYWRFTAASCRRLFGEIFGAERVTVTTMGNVGAATAFLMGLAAEEVPRRVLDEHDPYFPILVGVRSVKGR